ncbi:Acg family FMN-binding oxidoreductase [Actinoplanes sp. NPDC049265]|uniref:Acg family FMN-binding oxidoreductase n=1 Tax=Actinoplanes sp. NPDC049265 TaxID=3363902 RepID=UPI00370FEAA2
MMASSRTFDAQAVTLALNNATTAAGHAPSIDHAPPWRWRRHGDQLELWIQDGRTLAATAPTRQLSILSCGAALHHAFISLAADGWHSIVTRLPNAARPGHLATVRVDARIPIEPAATRRLQTIGLRHTDRRPMAGTPVDADTLRSIAAAAESRGTRLHLLRPRQIFDLAAATDHAQHVEADDPAAQKESTNWVGGFRTLGTGTPTTLPRRASPGTAPRRDFGPGDTDIADTRNRAAVFAVLYGAGEGDLDWLRAGESLSAVWLTATELAISVRPLSATIEVPDTRETIRRLLPGPGHPYLVLRFGALNPDAVKPPLTQRLPVERTVGPRRGAS